MKNFRVGAFYRNDFFVGEFFEALFPLVVREVPIALVNQHQQIREPAIRRKGAFERWRARLAPWSEQIRAFRNEGFYERFPAKGQIERVARIHRELARQAGVAVRGRKEAGDPVV